jgi:hypothetical protein
MRHIIVSTLFGITLLTSLTGAAAGPRPTISTPVSRGTRTILVDGVHSTTSGQFAVKLYLTPRNKIRGQMTLTDAATSTRVVYTVRDQVVVARGVVGEQRVRETLSLSEFFLIDLTGNQPTVKLAKVKFTCPGLIAKLICAVASEIVAACITDGEIFGIPCGDGGGDSGGGGTTGGDDDSDGTSTTG